MRWILAIFVLSLSAATIKVCPSGTCGGTACSGSACTTINAAIIAASCGDVIQPVAAETHFGGDGNNSINNPIRLRYKGCTASNPITIETDQIASLPTGGTGPGATQLTPDYADAATRLIPQINNVGQGNLILTDAGVARCAQTLTIGSPSNATRTPNTVVAPDLGYGVDGDTLTSNTTSTAIHSIAWSFTPGVIGQVTIFFSPIPVDRLTANVDGAATATATVNSGTGIANGDTIMLDEEAMTVGSGGGTASLAGITRGALSTTAQVAHPYCIPGEGGSPPCNSLIGPVFNITQKLHQAALRIDSNVMIADAVGPGNAPQVVSCPASWTCSVLDVGPLDGALSHWYLMKLTAPPSYTPVDSHVYFDLASGGTNNYAGTTSDALYFYRPTMVTGAQQDGTYQCPAAGYVLRGLELTGGSGGSNYALAVLPDQTSISADHFTKEQFPHDITFDQVLFRQNYLTQPTRLCVEDFGINTKFINSTYTGCASATNQADGSVISASSQGPTTIRNNYLTGSTSGIGLGALWSTRAFPGGDLDYYYSTVGCNAGCNGTIEVGNNFVWMPEFIRWRYWIPNVHVSPGTKWAISQGGYWQLVAQTSGTTSASEPAWNYTPGGTTTDGTVTWKMELSGNFPNNSHELVPSTAYGLGWWVWDPCESAPFGPAQVARVSVAGSTDGSAACFPAQAPGTTFTEGTVTFRFISTVWASTFAFKAQDVIGILSGTWNEYVLSNCTSGSTTPSWNLVEGGTTVDGTCIWHSTQIGGFIQTTKNLLDAKGHVNGHWHHNTFFNAWTQGNGGAGQGCIAEMRSFTGQGGPWSAVQNIVFENSIMSDGQAGFNMLGIGGQDDPWLSTYCVSGSTLLSSKLCPLNTYINGQGFTNITLRNVKFSNINVTPNTTITPPTAFSSALPPTLLQETGPINGLVMSHIAADGVAASSNVLAATSSFPVANAQFSNSISRTAARFFNCSIGTFGALSFNCGVSGSAGYNEFPAINYTWANVPYTAGAYVATTYPSQTAVFSSTSIFGGNVFSGATLAGTPTCAHDSCVNQVPSNNRTDAWTSLNLNSYGAIPAGNGAFNTGNDGNNPGVDPDQLPLVINPTVQVSDRAAVVTFYCNSACRQSGIAPLVQLSTQPDFDLSQTTWVVPAIDPSLHAPDAHGAAINTFQYDTAIQNGGSYSAIVTGLSASTTYWLRVNTGGAIYGIVNGTNTPASFTTLSTLSGTPTTTVTTAVTSNITGSAGANNMVIEYGTTYSRSANTITGGSTTSPVGCTVGGGACTINLSSSAGVPVYYRYKVRDVSNAVLITEPVQVWLPGGASGGISWAAITSGTWAGLTSSTWATILP